MWILSDLTKNTGLMRNSGNHKFLSIKILIYVSFYILGYLEIVLLFCWDSDNIFIKISIPTIRYLATRESSL